MNNKNNTITINGKPYLIKSNSRGNQVKINNLWYYYKEDSDILFKRAIALWVDTPEGKKRITKETTWFKTITEVNNAAEDMRVDFRRGNIVYTGAVTKATTKSYKEVFDEFIKMEKDKAIDTGKDYSYKKLVSHHKNYIMNDKVINFKNKDVSEITISDVKRLKNSINSLALKKKRTRQTVTLIFGSLDKVLTYCYENDYTDRLIHEVPIKAKGISSKKIGEEGFLTKEQFDEVLKVILNDNFIFSKRDDIKETTYRKKLYYTALNMLFYTGLRKGELFGLKWKDIQESTFNVERSLNAVALYARESESSYREVEPKTESSKRKQTLPNSMIKILEEWKNFIREYGLSASNEDYIFKDINDQHFKNSTFTRSFNKIIKKSRIEEKYNKSINIHSMRHSACTYLVTEMKKKNPQATLSTIENSVGQYLGHSVGGTMVRDVYFHFYEDEEESLLEQLLLEI